jgi:hypothetical protein
MAATDRKRVTRPELVGAILSLARERSACREVLDITVEGEGTDWVVSRISVARPETLPQASWAMAVVEARLRELFSLDPAGLAGDD